MFLIFTLITTNYLLWVVCFYTHQITERDYFGIMVLMWVPLTIIVVISVMCHKKGEKWECW